MAWRVELFRKPEIDDPDGAEVTAAVRELGVGRLERARLGRGYLLPPELARERVQSICSELLCDPVLDELRIYAPGETPPAPEGLHRVLVARKPGVMDPVAVTVEGALQRGAMTDGVEPSVSTFRAWELAGELSRAELCEIGRRVLGNETIEDLLIESESLHYGAPPAPPLHGRVEVPLREVDDTQLETLSREGGLSLDLNEMRAIQAHFRGLDREPTACELETLAQTWSEHCNHKTFAGPVEMNAGKEDARRYENLLKETIKKATVELDRDFCVSVFHDNAGIVEFDQGFDVCIKVETHNHPSAIDPYGGAGTGIGGVIRDVLGVGLGAQPIANTDAFFVGPLELPTEELPKGSMHPRRILRGVVAGVRDYGNRMGIPTVNGGVWFDQGYIANPLVYAGTVGLIPHEFAHKEVRPGDLVVVVGGRTGRDGIHGATFSSRELHEESDVVSSAAVQIGDPITEKKVLDGLLRARDARLYRGITDCGAGGLSSAVGEMGAECGASVRLDAVPLKYPGLSPEEIWISEAQERMVLAVQPENREKLLATFAAEDVEATVIGEFTDTGKLELLFEGETVGELDMHFLHEGTPKRVRTASFNPPTHTDPGCPACADAGTTLLALLGAPNIASKEWIVRQYDHEVMARSVVKPFVGVRADGPGDAAVLQPLPSSRKGISISCGANPRYGPLDPYRMATAVIDEAMRNAVAVGGDPDRTAILDNFSWGNCEKPDRMGSLVLASEGCRDAAIAFATPFISGKDSLNNEYRVGDRTLSIPPTLYVTALAIVPDIARSLTMDLKCAGNPLYLVGTTHAELGGSEYLSLLGREGGVTPAPDLERAPALLRALHTALREGCARACHDLSEGGLAVAAAEMAFAGDLGAEIELDSVPLEAELPADCDPDALRLFSESCTRFLVEVDPARVADFEGHLQAHPIARIGEVREEPLLRVVGVDGAPRIELELDALRRAHQGSFQG